MAGKRSGKFYRTNEADVMQRLGLQPTKGSGSGWIEKEDGQSEHVICQLKSTDANSMRIHKQDLDTLQYNAAVSHKLPVFAVQFLSSDEVYLVLKPEVLSEVVEYLKTGEYHTNAANEFVGVDVTGLEDVTVAPKRIVRSSSSAREEFTKAQQQKYKKGKRSAL